MPLRFRSLIRPLAVLAFVALAAGIVHEARAQTQGTTRAQGRAVGRDEAPPPPVIPREPLRDVREDMRRFVQDLSMYARQLRRDFVVVVRGGTGLLTKSDGFLNDKRLPAMTYVRSIDGVIADAVFYGRPSVGEATPEDTSARLVGELKQARDLGLAALTMEYAREPATVDRAYRKAAGEGFVPFVAPEKGYRLNGIPAYPARPFQENGDSVTTLGQVRNFLCLGDSTTFGRQEDFAMKVHGTNYDMVAVDVFHRRREFLTAQTVETLKFKKMGARRLVLARVDIGTAASYRYYWKPDWHQRPPSFIDAPTPDEPDRHYVKFWDPQWQRIIFGDASSYLYGIINDLGYDGVVLEGVDAYRYFEGDLGQ